MLTLPCCTQRGPAHGQTLEEILASAFHHGQRWEPAPYPQLKNKKRAGLGKLCTLSMPPLQDRAETPSLWDPDWKKHDKAGGKQLICCCHGLQCLGGGFGAADGNS